MGATFNTGYLENLILYNGSNNIGIGTSADATYKVTLGGSLLGTSATFTNASGAFIGVTVTTTDTTGSSRLRATSTGGNITDVISYSASHASRANQAWLGGDGSSTVTVLQAGGVEFMRGASTGAATFSSSVQSTGLLSRREAAGNDGYIAYLTTGVQNTVMGFNNSGSTNGYGVLNNYSYFGNLNAYGLQFTTNGAVVLTINTTGAATFSSSISATSATFSGSVEATRYQATSSSASLVAYGVGTGLGMYNAGTNTIGFATASTQRLTIDGNGAATFSSSVTANGSATTNAAFIANNTVGSGGTSQYYIDFTAGASTIGRIFRGNGASGVVGNGLNIDNFDGFQIRLNQLGGSGGTCNILGGNVGIGCSPAVKLHVYGVPNTNNDAVYNLVLQDPSAYNTRIGAGISFGGFYDTTNTTYTFANIKGFKENTTLGDYAGALAFSTRTNGGNPTERMRITSGGSVLIGTSANNWVGNGFTLSSDSGTTKWLNGPYAASPTQFYVTAAAGGGVYLSSTSATSWTSNSDIRLKDIIKPIENVLSNIMSLNPIIFSWKHDNDKKENLGLIAQEVEKIFPEIIDLNGQEMLGVRYTEFIPVLIKAIQEQTVIINELKQKVEYLESK